MKDSNVFLDPGSRSEVRWDAATNLATRVGARLVGGDISPIVAFDRWMERDAGLRDTFLARVK